MFYELIVLIVVCTKKTISDILTTTAELGFFIRARKLKQQKNIPWSTHTRTFGAYIVLCSPEMYRQHFILHIIVCSYFYA